MGNADQKNVERKLNELKRLTGLSLHMDLPDAAELPAHEAEEAASYILHQLDALISSYKETNSKEAIYKRWIT